jgi:hypothetical protein
VLAVGVVELLVRLKGAALAPRAVSGSPSAQTVRTCACLPAHASHPPSAIPPTHPIEHLGTQQDLDLDLDRRLPSPPLYHDIAP